ncbi:MAG: hypothetical protein ACON49_03305 [Candidatus Puniceispirillaceae bacterium]
MVEYQSGLDDLMITHGASLAEHKAQPDVIISERRHLMITQLSFFASQMAKLKKQLAVFDVQDIPSFSNVEASSLVMAVRVEMEKIWLVSEQSHEALKKEFYPLDLSSAKSVMRLSGPRAGDVMARLCAVDFRDDTRCFYATAIHHVGVHIHHHHDIYDIYMPRSFGESLAELVIDISRQYHVQMA